MINNEIANILINYKKEEYPLKLRDSEIDTILKVLEENDKLKQSIIQQNNRNQSMLEDCSKELVLNLELREENDKLKTEIEQLSKVNNSLVKLNDKQRKEIEQLKERIEIKDNNFELYSYALDEIEQLKAELEQSVKLPCKIGDNYVLVFNSYGELFITKGWELSEITIIKDDVILDFYCSTTMEEEERSLNSFGKTIFYTEKEAERALKGGVEE